jgi:hypothetical protein
MNTNAIIQQLKARLDRLKETRERIENAIEAIRELGDSEGPAEAPKKRRMSATARAKIAAAQRARWAKQKNDKK